MIIGNHPGPWNSFYLRPDNKGLPMLEIKRKYLAEQLQYEEYLMIHMMQAQGASYTELPLSQTPEIEILAEDGSPLITENGIYIAA